MIYFQNAAFYRTENFKASARKWLVLFVCPKTEGGAAFVSGERGVPAGGAGEHPEVYLDGADYHESRGSPYVWE